MQILYFATFYIRKRRVLCSTKREICIKRFYKRHETKYNDYWRRNFRTFSRVTFASRGLSIIEASDRAGGRIKTDSVNGFRLDRGFQFY
jgi:hypothetical protein